MKRTELSLVNRIDQDQQETLHNLNIITMIISRHNETPIKIFIHNDKSTNKRKLMRAASRISDYAIRIRIEPFKKNGIDTARGKGVVESFKGKGHKFLSVAIKRVVLVSGGVV